MATKRSNPFVEDFMPQRKVHLGLKQFNNNEDRLQEVYGKHILMNNLDLCMFVFDKYILY